MSILQLPALATPRFQLHPYQARLVNELRLAYREDRDPCLTLPTAGGKTVICGGLAQASQDRNRHLWFAVHKDFLLQQTCKTFQEMGIEHGVLAAGQPVVWANTMVVSIDTLRSRMHKLTQKPDVLVLDECHHLPAKSWQSVWDWCGPDCFFIGLTATPCRLDGRGLAPAAEGAPGFTKLILGPTVSELMQMGFLSRYKAYAPSKPNLKGVGKTAGDYNRKQLKKAVTAQVIVGDIVGHYQRLAAGKRMIYFCVSVDYSQQLAQAFTAAGIPAQHLDGRDSTDSRRAAAQAFARGQLQILTNCALFSEGYDLAAQAGMPCTVEGVGLVRPTLSESLAIQQMGRCLRRKDYPAIILDHAGVVEAHGLPDSDRDWSLAGREKRPAAAGTKTCPSCYAILKRTAGHCPHCGHSFAPPAAGGRQIKAVDGNLTEIDAAEFNRRRQSWSVVVGQCKTYSDFVKAAQYLGYKPGWAHYAWREFQQNGYVSRRGRL